MTWHQTHETLPNPGVFCLTRRTASSVPQVAVLVAGKWYVQSPDDEWLCNIETPEYWAKIRDV